MIVIVLLIDNIQCMSTIQVFFLSVQNVVIKKNPLLESQQAAAMNKARYFKGNEK